MIINKYLIAIIIIGATISCDNKSEKSNDQAVATEIEDTKAESELSQKIKETFKAKYPSAEDVEWEIDDNGYWEAGFKIDGEKYRADYKKDGSWIETENSIKYDELPKAVQETLENEYDKDNITEIEMVDHHTKGKFYDVEFKQKGKNKDVEIDVSGKKLN